eukprot:CAMPEP_0116907374 /NCGR_PEP_ID=MMETSP0467-20121206/13078_1 /TAXON_ID=283647 /ORGANISM="Mesodinium pulex, Strain SPMC105" /LENGTH=99 /DNA_ID=CAMNT_0004582401 /DNA_START=638 /DNA_END=937 /DNA_ORIENTATION=+
MEQTPVDTRKNKNKTLFSDKDLGSGNVNQIKLDLTHTLSNADADADLEGPVEEFSSLKKYYNDTKEYKQYKQIKRDFNNDKYNENEFLDFDKVNADDFD